MRQLCLFVLLLGMGLMLTANRVEAWSPTLQLGLESNDNVTKSIREEKGDLAFTAMLDVSALRILNRDWQLSYGGTFQTSAWQEYSGLNLTELGGHISLRRKYGLGPYAPRLEIQAESTRQFSKVDEWEGYWLRGSATFTKRFTPEWQTALRVGYDQFYAKRDVYSTNSTSLIGTINYDPNENWRVFMSTGYATGDHLSWCRNSWGSFAGTTQWLDGIFGGDWFPYQASGHTIITSIGLARALGPNSTLSLEYDVSETFSPKDHVYRDHIIRLQFIHAF